MSETTLEKAAAPANAETPIPTGIWLTPFGMVITLSSFLFKDDPDHRPLQGLVSKRFSPKAVEEVRPDQFDIRRKDIDISHLAAANICASERIRSARGNPRADTTLPEPVVGEAGMEYRPPELPRIEGAVGESQVNLSLQIKLRMTAETGEARSLVNAG